MEALTRTEEQIMQIIWRLEKCFVKEIISEMSSPSPPYNTVSSVVRILERKGFLSHTAYGKTHQYHPLISKEIYTKLALKKVMGSYFDGSISNLLSFFSKEENLSSDELKELKKILKEGTQES